MYATRQHNNGKLCSRTTIAGEVSDLNVQLISYKNCQYVYWRFINQSGETYRHLIISRDHMHKAHFEILIATDTRRIRDEEHSVQEKVEILVRAHCLNVQNQQSICCSEALFCFYIYSCDDSSYYPPLTRQQKEFYSIAVKVHAHMGIVDYRDKSLGALVHSKNVDILSCVCVRHWLEFKFEKKNRNTHCHSSSSRCCHKNNLLTLRYFCVSLL